MKAKSIRHKVGKEYVYAPGGFEMNWEAINTMYDQPQCYLVALDDRQIVVILALFKFLKFSHLWGFTKRAEWSQAEWDKWDTIQAFVAEMELCLMSGCDVQQLITTQQETNKLLRLAIEALIGGSVNFSTDPVVPDTADYSQTGLAPKFRTSNWIAPDENLADILANSLFGNFPNIPNPLNGTGLADILDDEIQVLHNRFRMADSSLFNPLNDEKNITEALETLLRRDKLTDLETLFTPNIVTVLEDIFYAKAQRAEDKAKDPNTPEEDQSWRDNLIKLIEKKATELNIPQVVTQWLVDKLNEETLSISEILLMLAQAEGPGKSKSIVSAVRGLEMMVNLNNYNGCCGSEDCNCGNCSETTITANGNGADATYNLGCGDDGEVIDV